MPAAASSSTAKPRRLWRRLLGWAVTLLLFLVVTAGVGIWYTILYFASDEIKRFEDVIGTEGGIVEFRSLRVSNVRLYPYVNVRLYDFHLYEAKEQGDAAEILYVEEAVLPLTLDLFWNMQGSIDEVIVCGGRARIIKGEDGLTNIARVLGAEAGEGEAVGEEVESEAAEARIKLAPTATFTLERFEVSFDDPAKETFVGGRLNRAYVTDAVFKNGFAAKLALDLHMHGLQFKRAHGSFVDSADVRGDLDLSVREGVFRAVSPHLMIGGNDVDVDVVFYTRRDSISSLIFGIAETDLPAARAVLNDQVRKAIKPFDVEGLFSSVTTISGTFAQGNKPHVSVELRLPGNRARVDREVFEDTRLVARFLNWPADTSADQRGIRFEIDSVATRYYGFDITSTDAIVTAEPGEQALLRATAHVTGPASLISPLVQSDEFIFTRGRVVADATVDGPPEKLFELIDKSVADIHIYQPTVRLPAAGAVLPFKQIDLQKVADHVQFHIVGTTPGGSHDYLLAGDLYGMGYLLGTDLSQEVRSKVTFTSDYLTWTDAVDMLGSALEGEGKASASAKTDAEKKAGLKESLALIESSFRPEIDIAIDRFGYYGAEVQNFTTGMHFRGAEAVVLERTSFLVDTARVQFSGELGIDTTRQTPFSFTLDAGHLDLDHLAQQLDYFNLPLLRELAPLPNDVGLSIRQRGQLDASDGILYDQTEGMIALKSNRLKPFEALIEFEPDRPGVIDFQSTRARLSGSPELFNDFFKTESFFFRRGHFEFDLGYAGLMPDLRTLIDREAMQLRVSDVAVGFAEAEVAIPVHHLYLDMRRDTGTVELLVKSDDGSQELLVSGQANSVSEVVLGGTGKQFSSAVNVSSPRLVWQDISDLLQAMTFEDAPVDTVGIDTVKEAVYLRETIRGLMKKFQPTVALHIDELQLTNALVVTDVKSGLRMDTAQVLHVDTTGFDFSGGLLRAAGTVDMADLENMPFGGSLESDHLNIAALLEGLEYFGNADLAAAKQLRGDMSLAVDVVGAVVGAVDQGKLSPETRGTLNLELRDVTVEGLRGIDELAAKFKMRKRFKVLRLAPVRVNATFEGNSIHIPQTEIQSNAVLAFIEGDINLDTTSSLLLSLPLANIFRGNLDTVPAPKGFDANRFKIHLDFRQPAEGKLRTKLRFRRKKWLEERDKRID